MRRILMAVLGAAALAGCVTRQDFEAKQAELAACLEAAEGHRRETERCQLRSEAALRACNEGRMGLEQGLAFANQELGSCRRDVASLRGQARAELVACVDARHKAESDHAEASRNHEQCRAELTGLKVDVEALTRRAESLREKFQGEIAERNVEIEQLKDQLTVRVLDRILFRSGSADILPEGESVLNKLGGVFSEIEDYIRVEGHTDVVPISERLKARYASNWELSAARASSVVRYFEHGHGISPLRMEAVAFSQYRPVAVGDTAEELARNRRVEIVLTAPKVDRPPTGNRTGES